MRNRAPHFLPAIWAVGGVLVTAALLLSILEIKSLDNRIGENRGQIEALSRTIDTLTTAIQEKDQQIISLGGTPSPVPGTTASRLPSRSPGPTPTATKTVVRVVPVPGPTVTVTAKPKPAPSQSAGPLPVPLPTLTPLGASSRLFRVVK